MLDEAWEAVPVVSVPARRRKTSLVQTMVTVLLVLMALGALVGAAYWVYADFLHQQTDRGKCFVFAPSDCTSLSRDYVEDVIGQPLPAAAEIVDSGSSLTLKSGKDWALMRSSSAADFAGFTGGAADRARDPSVPRSVLSEMGFDEVTQYKFRDDGSDGYTLFYTGLDAQGEVVAYVSKFHDL